MPQSSRHFVYKIASALTFLLAAAVPASAQDPTVLTTGESVTGVLAPGDTARFTVLTESGYLVRGYVDQRSTNVAVRIVDPSGEALRRVDLRDRGAEPFQFETDQEGRYGIQVLSLDETGGEFMIRVEVAEPLSDDPAELARQLLSGFAGPDSPGAGVRVWRDGETVFTGTWGMADLTHQIPFRPDTPTNIGSTSKQFTGFAVMLLVERGLVSLDDDVRTHIPELPDFGDPVKVRYLLTHATGYREIYNLLIMAGRRFDEGDHVDRREILQVVQNQPTLQNVPGEEWNYNNTAYGLAALLVERISGQSFTDFMEESVFAPLGMTRSIARPHAASIVPGRSTGYLPDRAGGWRQARDLGGAVGAGAVYASLEDLQRWAENYAAPRVGTPATMEEMVTPFVTTVGDTTTYGLGLMIDEQRGLKRIHHGGADVAHRSMLAMYPEINAGITVQGNSSIFDSGLAFRLAEAFFGEFMEPEEKPAEEPGDEDAADEGATEEGEAEPWAPTAAELAAFTGRFFSEELLAFYDVVLDEEEGALSLRHFRRDDAAMTPGDPDHFTAANIRISFERDRHGRVNAFYMDNMRTRDVRFVRVP